MGSKAVGVALGYCGTRCYIVYLMLIITKMKKDACLRYDMTKAKHKGDLTKDTYSLAIGTRMTMRRKEATGAASRSNMMIREEIFEAASPQEESRE